VAREDAPRYGPPDALSSPRYAGVKTFARCPLVEDPDGVDVAVVGIPFDTATTNRPGARFGPEAIRSASVMLRPYNPVQGAQVFGRLSVADLGDLRVTPGNAEKTVGQIAEQLEPVVRSGARTLCLGGDHLVVLGELRAHAAVHGPLGVVLLDAHADVWDTYCGERYYHGSPFRRALEEGLVDPGRSLLAGMRGPVYGPDDENMPRELGFEVISGEELVALSHEEYGERVRRRVAEGPVFLSFDVDAESPILAEGRRYAEHPGAILLDVRTRNEYVQGHIDGSTLIPLDQLSASLTQLAAVEAPIILICHSGARASTAGVRLHARRDDVRRQRAPGTAHDP